MNLIIFLLITVLPTEQLELGYVKIIPPVYFKQIQWLTIYETTVPLIWKIKLGNHIENTEHEVCKQDPNSSSCLLLKEMSRTFDNDELILMQKWEVWKSRSQRQILTPFLIGTIFGGGFLSPVFKPIISFFGHEETEEAYKRKIDTEVSSLSDDLRNFQNTIYNYTTNRAKNEKKAFNLIHKEIEEINANLTSEVKNIYNYISMILKILEAKLYIIELKDNINLCLQNLMPYRLIGYENLNTFLTNYSKEINEKGYDFALTIQQMLRLNNAHCSIKNDYIYVSFDAPVYKTNITWRFYEIIYLRFLYKTQICKIQNKYESKKSFLAISSRGRYIILQENEKCNIDSGICQINAYDQEINEEIDCIKAIYQGKKVDELKDLCTFMCHQKKGLGVKQIDQSTLIITNPKTIFQKCGTSENVHIFDKMGAIEIKMGSCTCSYIIDNKTYITPDINCNINTKLQNENIYQTLPSLWSFTNLSANDALAHRIGVNISDWDLFNKNWIDTMPIINYTRDYNRNIDSVPFNMEIIHIWLIIISAILFLNFVLLLSLMRVVYVYRFYHVP